MDGRSFGFYTLSLAFVASAVGYSTSISAQTVGSQIGTVSMTADRSLVVRYDKKVMGHAFSSLKIRPDQEAYAGYLDLVGGLHVGETKALLSYAGLVTMNADRSLTVTRYSGGAPGQPISEPWNYTVTPGDEKYTELLQEIGGLEPGHSKGMAR